MATLVEEEIINNAINNVKNRTTTLEQQEKLLTETINETSGKLFSAAFTYNQNTYKLNLGSDELESALNELYKTIIKQIQILIVNDKRNKLEDVYRRIRRTMNKVNNQPIKMLLWNIYNYLIAKTGEAITASSPMPPLLPTECFPHGVQGYIWRW
jgi:hypothetical protein